MINIEKINQEFLNKLFDSNILPRVRINKSEKFSQEYSDEELAEIRRIIGQRLTVVGIDIYRYSRLPPEKQMFVPHLFDLIYDYSWDLITQNFNFLFQHYDAMYRSNREQLIKHSEFFLNTGDGGYQILETPIHAIIFILTIATILRLYNSDMFMRKLHAKIGNIEVRYVITVDDVYQYNCKCNKNFYGASIINNSRILSKDRLNRLIIDNNTYSWFLDRTIGIENLMSLGLLSIKDIPEFSNYDQTKIDEGNNALIQKENLGTVQEGIKSIDVQKIGRIKQKGDHLDIYNLHMQAVIHYRAFLQETEQTITVSVGNLNTSGIESEET